MSGHRNAAFDDENIILCKGQFVQALYVNPTPHSKRTPRICMLKRALGLMYVGAMYVGAMSLAETSQLGLFRVSIL